MASLVPDNPFDMQPPAAPTAGPPAPAPQGIIGQASQAGQAATYTPTTTQVDRATQTTAGQIDSLLAGDSPIIQRARTLATQQMAKRGLVNSSMNAEAGVAAVIDRVTPIAQTDAQIYDQRARENAGIINQAGMFNTGEANKFGLQGNEQKFQSGMEQARQQFTAAQANLDRAQQTLITDKGIAAQQNLQKSQQDFQAAQAQIDRQQQVTVLGIQQTWQGQQNELQRNMQMAVATMEQNGMDRRQAEQIASQQFMQQQTLAQQQALFQLEQAGIQNRFDQQQALTSSQFNAEQLNADRRLVQQQEFQLQQMGYQARLSRETLPTSFAADVSRQTQASINSVLADPNLTPEARQGAVNNIVNSANAQLDWAESFYGTSVPNISTPTSNGAPVAPAPAPAFFGSPSGSSWLNDTA